MGHLRRRPPEHKNQQVRAMRNLVIILFVFIIGSSISLSSEVYVERDATGKPTALVHNGPSSKLVAFVKDKNNHALLATVRTVRLMQHDVDADEIACLRVLESLQTLELGDHPDEVNFSADALSQIGALATVEHLSVYGAGKLNDFSWLGDLPKLQSLELSSNSLYSEAVFQQIRSCRRLETLYVHCDFPITDLEWLKPLTKLTFIDLRATEVKIADCSVFEGLHALTHLAIDGHAFSSREVGELASRCGNRLKFLRIDVDSNCTIEPFVGFTNLKELVVLCPGSSVPGAKNCHANLLLYGQPEKVKKQEKKQEKEKQKEKDRHNPLQGNKGEEKGEEREEKEEKDRHNP